MALVRDSAWYYFCLGNPGLSVLTVWFGLRAVAERDRIGCLLVLLLLLYPGLLLSSLGFITPRYLFPEVMIGAVLVGRQWDRIRVQLPARALVRRAATALVVATTSVSAIQSGLVAYECVVEPRSPATRWLMENVQRGSQVEHYQMVHSLPGIEAAGLVPIHRQAMERKDFEERRPQLVCVVDNERWHWSREQVAFVEWLFSGPPGYELVRFGRPASPIARLYLPCGLDTRIRPRIAILRREAP